MNANQLISHLQGLIAADPSVATLPVYLPDREWGSYEADSAVVQEVYESLWDGSHPRRVRLS